MTVQMSDTLGRKNRSKTAGWFLKSFSHFCFQIDASLFMMNDNKDERLIHSRTTKVIRQHLVLKIVKQLFAQAFSCCDICTLTYHPLP